MVGFVVCLDLPQTQVFLSVIPLWSAPAFFFLLVFALIDKTDEFQLLFFILQVRGMQFISDGFLQVSWHVVQLHTQLYQQIKHTMVDRGHPPRELFSIAVKKSHV